MTDDISKRDLQRDLADLKREDSHTVPIFGHRRDDGTLVDENGNQIETALFVSKEPRTNEQEDQA